MIFIENNNINAPQQSICEVFDFGQDNFTNLDLISAYKILNIHFLGEFNEQVKCTYA